MSRKTKRSIPTVAQPPKMVTVQKIGFWLMIRDVATHAMNKGQFLGVAIAGLVALIIWRAPAEFSGEVLDRIFRNLTTLKGASYVLNLVLAAAWAFHVRWLIHSTAEEIDRIGREKTKLQEQLTNRILSNPHPTGPHHES